MFEPVPNTIAPTGVPFTECSLDEYPSSDILCAMPSRNRRNPLALAILSCLYERPMHPYEVALTLRQRAKHESIRLNYGSLYSVVEGLERSGLITARETKREGRRPERTVYEITDDGARELVDWLSELVATPAKEYLQFEAALSLLAVLSPEEAVSLLDQRANTLRLLIAARRGARAGVERQGLPRLFTIEDEYVEALQTAELEWVERLVKEIDGGSLEGIEMWRAWHEHLAAGTTPPSWHGGGGGEAGANDDDTTRGGTA
jgi:DNA-binding PadR family transcriptional regulator